MGNEFANPTRGQSLCYATLCVGLLAVRIPLGRLTWVGTVNLHTILETTATVLSFVAGVMALLRHYSQKTFPYLILGTGFLGASLLDGYHAVVTSTLCTSCTPSSLSALIPWTGGASRLFLSMLLCGGLFIWRDQIRDRNWERAVYAVAGGWTLASYAFFLLVPLPQADQPQWPVHRAAELIVGMFFAATAVGLLWKGDWKGDEFRHWLLLFLFTGAMGQLVYMPFSGKLFDALYLTAHLLKILSYIFVLAGLFHSMFSIFRQEAESVYDLRRADESFAAEVEERRRAEEALQQSRDE